MTSVRLLHILSVLVVLFEITPSMGGNGDLEMPLKLQVHLSKKTYLLGEPVTAHLVFENVSDQIIMFNKAYNVFQECKLVFNILSPSNKKPIETLPLLGKRKLLNKSDFVKLRGGERFETEINISDWYRLDEIGLYKIYAEYTNSESGENIQSLFGRVRAWTGHIISDSKSFEIR